MIVLVVLFAVVVVVAMFVPHGRAPAKVSSAPLAPPAETRWTAWDDHQVARLLDDIPPC